VQYRVFPLSHVLHLSESPNVITSFDDLLEEAGCIAWTGGWRAVVVMVGS
jgi:hypothetical protein